MSSFMPTQEEALRAYFRELRESAFEEGKREGRRDVAKRMIRGGKVSDPDVAYYCDLSLDEVRELRENLD